MTEKTCIKVKFKSSPDLLVQPCFKHIPFVNPCQPFCASRVSKGRLPAPHLSVLWQMLEV